MKKTFEKTQNLLADLKKKRKEMEQKAEKNPVDFIKEMGIDLANITPEELQKIASELQNSIKPLEDIYSGKSFKDLNNYHSKVKNHDVSSELEKRKLQELAVIAFYQKDFKKKNGICFISNHECNKIIDAHSIQQNGELSLITQNDKVLHFAENIKSKAKEKLTLNIKNASTFRGFCHKHDQIFEPIDKNLTNSDEERHFLCSFRSFAYSYHNIKAFKEFYLGFSNNSADALTPLVQTIKKLAKSINLKPPSEFKNLNVPKATPEQIELLHIQRFEKHRDLLLKYQTKKEYNQLDYFVYQTNHLCPIVCASWMVMHIRMGNGFLVNVSEAQPYFGFPIIISVLPSQKQTKIVLARFKSDNGSELIFNHLKSLAKTELEIELSKMIIKNTENYYLSPKFWDRLSSVEQEIILGAIRTKSKNSPESPINFDMINFFEKKYQLS